MRPALAADFTGVTELDVSLAQVPEKPATTRGIERLPIHVSPGSPQVLRIARRKGVETVMI